MTCPKNLSLDSFEIIELVVIGARGVLGANVPDLAELACDHKSENVFHLLESNYGRGTLWAITIQSAPVPVVSGYTSDTTSAIPRIVLIFIQT